MLSRFKSSTSSTSKVNKPLEIEHSFFKKNVFNIYRSILKCEHCSDKFYNDKIYLQCRDCQINVHKKCSKLAAMNCKKKALTGLDSDSMDIEESVAAQVLPVSEPMVNELVGNNLKKMSLDDRNSSVQKQDSDEQMVSSIDTDELKKANYNDVLPTEETSATGRTSRYRKTNNKQGTQIMLQRISQRVKKTNGFFWSGHMFYYSNSNTEVNFIQASKLFDQKLRFSKII